MADYDLHMLDLAFASTDAAEGFGTPDGSQFTPGTSTITIAQGATSQIVQVTDTNDGTFDDDTGNAQVLTSDTTINSSTYVAGTQIEAEYTVDVQDTLGNTYKIAFISLAWADYNIEAFAFMGPRPPFGEALTVVSTSDSFYGTMPYSSSSPACFEAGARIDTPHGPVRADRLRSGDRVHIACGGTARVALLLHSWHWPGKRDAPVLFRPGALGRGLPHRRLILSPQHRVLMPGSDALAPACAFRSLPRIGPRGGDGPLHYVHVVLARHALIRAEGVICESFWPGPQAMAALPAAARRAVRAAMGPEPRQAAPFLTAQEARAALGAAESMFA